MNTHTNKQDKGFTLVELLIVIVILGILATVTVFAVTGITDKGKDSACKADLKTLQTAEEANMANVGVYASEADLVTAGLMRAVSPNFDVTVTPAVVGPPAVLAKYVLNGVAGTACAGVTG